MPYCYADVPSQAGKTVLITGGNIGLGLSLAKDFLGKNPAAPKGGLPPEKQPACVILAARSRAKALKAIETHLKSDPRVKFLELDLASLDSVRQAASALVSGSSDEKFEHFAQPIARLDTLVLNAGLNTPNKLTTKEGFEMTFGVCHVGHFVFTKHVWTLLLKADKARVVPVSSGAHKFKNAKVDLQDLNYDSRKYQGLEAYSQAKLANVYFCRELATRCGNFGKPGGDVGKASSKVTVVTLTPGLGNSGLIRDMPCCLRGIMHCFQTHPDSLSLNSLRAACDETLPSGSTYLVPERKDFWGPPKIGEMSELAKDDDMSRALWEKTEEMVGEKFSV